MQAYANWNESTEAAGNLTEREKGSFCFLIVVVSYNARYAKLREAKNTHFPDFCRLSLGWLIFWLSSTVLRSLHFLSYFFIVLFVSRLQILPVLCAAESVRLWFMLVRLFLQRLCVCFIMFHAAFYDLQFAAMVDHSSWFLCGHGLVCFCQNLPRMLLYGCPLTAYNVNYKGPWQHPVKPDRAMGLWTVSDVLCRFKYCLMNRQFLR